MRMSICPRWSHEGTPRSESITSVIQLLPPVPIWRYPKLKTKPLVGPRVIWVLIARMRFIPRKGDTQLFKQAPGRMVDVEVVQAGKKGLLRLEVVLKWNPTTGRGAPEGDVKLAQPPAEGSFLPDLPCLLCHCNVFSERRVLIVGEDVRDHGLKVAPLSSTIISCLAKERMSAVSLKRPPDRYYAWLLNENAFVPMTCNHACDADRCSKWWAGLSHQVPFRWAVGCSSWVDVLSPVVQYQRCRAGLKWAHRCVGTRWVLQRLRIRRRGLQALRCKITLWYAYRSPTINNEERQNYDE